jgi:hypothetical protein
MALIQTFGNYFAIYIQEGTTNQQASQVRTPFGVVVPYPLVDDGSDVKLPQTFTDVTNDSSIPWDFSTGIIKSYDIHLGIRGSTKFMLPLQGQEYTMVKGAGGYTHYPIGNYTATFLEYDSAFACIAPLSPIFYHRRASFVGPNTTITMPDAVTKFLFVGDGHVNANGKDIYGPAMIKIESADAVVTTITECSLMTIWE